MQGFGAVLCIRCELDELSLSGSLTDTTIRFLKRLDLKNSSQVRSPGSLVAVLDGGIIDPPPVWMMRQAGRYLPEYRRVRAKAGGFVELCLNPALAAEVTLQPVHRFGFDAAILFSDILIVPHALGVKLWFEEGEGPRLEPVADRESFARMRSTLDPKIVAPVYETIGRVRAALSPDQALIGFCGAPWTVATYLVAGRGTENKREALGLAAGDPVLFQEIIGRLVEASAAYLVGQLQAGADVVQIFDTWAGALTGEAFERWCLQPTVQIVRRVRGEIPRARIILFPKGVGIAELTRLVRESSANGVGIGSETDRKLARENLGLFAAIQGNLDPLALVAGGETLDRAVDEVLADFRGRRHIFNLGHGIRSWTPVEHVERMLKRIRER